MDWTAISMAFSGVSILSVVGAVVYFKPRLKIENLNADDKDVQVAQSSLMTLKEVSTQLKETHEAVGNMRNIISEQDENYHKLKRRVTKLIDIAEQQIGLKEYAESHLCTVVDCKLREPPFGTYKSSSDREELKRLVEELRKDEQSDIS